MSTTTHTLTPLTLSFMWLFLGGLVCAAVFLWVYVCVLVCMRAHWTDTVKPSPTLFEYQSWIFPLPQLNPLSLSFRGGPFWLRSGRRAGSATNQALWFVQFILPKPVVPFWGFCEWVWSGGPHRDMLFQVYSLKGAHEMVDIPGRCHIQIPFFVFIFYCFPSYPGSFRPSAAP